MIFFFQKDLVDSLDELRTEFGSDAVAGFKCISAIKDYGVAVFAHDAKGGAKGIDAASGAAALGKSADKTVQTHSVLSLEVGMISQGR